MIDYIVEIEVSTFKTYKITAVDAEDARQTVLESRLELEPIKSHEYVSVRRCVEDWS